MSAFRQLIFGMFPNHHNQPISTVTHQSTHIVHNQLGNQNKHIFNPTNWLAQVSIENYYTDSFMSSTGVASLSNEKALTDGAK